MCFSRLCCTWGDQVSHFPQDKGFLGHGTLSQKPEQSWRNWESWSPESYFSAHSRAFCVSLGIRSPSFYNHQACSSISQEPA